MEDKQEISYLNHTNQMEQNDICCPVLDLEHWDDKLHEWSDKGFLSETVYTCYYVPLNFRWVIRRLDKILENSEATVPHYLCLSEPLSPWKMMIYLAVDRKLEEKNYIELNGMFYSRVFDGPYKHIPKWWKQLHEIVKSKGFQTKRQFIWYTTCPKCAKKRGNNYVVLFASLND